MLKIINFAQGAWLTIGAYCAVVAVKLGLNPWAGLPIAFVAGAILGGVAELLIIRPLYRRPLDAILATWGLGIVIGQLVTLVFGRDVQLIPNLMSGTVRVLSVDYSVYRLFMLFAALAIGLVFALTIEGTRLGLSARAVIMLVMVADTSYLALAIACLVFGGAQVLVSTFISPVLGGISIAVLAALVLRISPRGFSHA